jgi:hypothetical protein
MQPAPPPDLTPAGIAARRMAEAERLSKTRRGRWVLRQVAVQEAADPVVQARTAYAQVRTVFQRRALERTQKLGLFGGGAYENNLRHQNRDNAATIEARESEGWRLETANSAFTPTGSKSPDKFWSSGQQTAIAGDQYTTYTFRRVAK